ncbi:MAG: hypothetical protein OEM85_14590 [Gammaproteobacteria bacterium]|nr:hypothetical protein [Gammaproteobacteria bacterium]
MSRRLSRISLALVILLSSEVWALGLGDIRINSALNEPLSARIELLAATAEELEGLTITMASAETFERYGIDRPFLLQGIQFNIVRSGRADGNFVQLRSAGPMAEPFITFLVEASWSRGRLLREYTVFLDPPTFTRPSADSAPAVQAPSRPAPADSGRIERATPPQESPAPAPARPPTRQAAPAQPKPQAPLDDTPYDTAAGGDYQVRRSETLWGIASRVRPDSRLTMNQTMLAIFEANPEAFGGNINILRAGASLRIPSADEIFRISRGDALAEAQRQHAEWTGGTVPPVEDRSTRPSLVLVPPDDDYVADTLGADTAADAEPVSREEEIEQRIAELEADVPQQRSLIEIRDNELAALRQELAQIRGEVYEPPVEDPFVGEADDQVVDEDTGEGPFPDYDDIMAEDDADDVAAEADATADIVRQPTPAEPGLVDRAMEVLKGWWTIIAGVVVLVGGALFWFMRRGGDGDDLDSWQPLDSDEVRGDSLSATESLKAPTRDDDSIMVVEQESTVLRPVDDTIEAPAPAIGADVGTGAATGQFDSLEDTFSSETAINLDQTDPIAEADFHMAYGLYDQAADLINGALSLEPERHDLLTKLCEIYFVWGNRDAFVDSAGRLKSTVGDAGSAEWDKIVIMGQQIAADDALFAGARAAGATKEVDLSFEAGMDESGALDMELISGTAISDDIVDLGGDIETLAGDAGEEIDFFVGGDAAESDVVYLESDDTSESPTIETPDFDVTREMEAAGEATAEMPARDSTLEAPTIEEQFEVLSGTAELPSIDEAFAGAAQSADATAEINLDDLGLDIDSLAETELASLDDLDATSESEVLEDTGINEAIADASAVTGRNLALDPDATGMQVGLSDDTGVREALDVEDALAATSEMPGFDEDTGIDEALLDATGLTQVLPDDLAVETASDVGAELSDDDATMLAHSYGDDDAQTLADDAATLLASLDEDEGEGDFDFAKTEALPKEAFTGDASLDETGELPAVASTDVDLDLDDLTAALQVSDAGDTVEQMRDDATVEQPRPVVSDEDVVTVAMGPDELSDDLSDARTMTEVGTKLDLARAYVDMGDPAGARSILEEVLDEGDQGQRQQAQQLLESLPS